MPLNITIFALIIVGGFIAYIYSVSKRIPYDVHLEVTDGEEARRVSFAELQEIFGDVFWTTQRGFHGSLFTESADTYIHGNIFCKDGEHYVLSSQKEYNLAMQWVKKLISDLK